MLNLSSLKLFYSKLFKSESSQQEAEFTIFYWFQSASGKHYQRGK